MRLPRLSEHRALAEDRTQDVLESAEPARTEEVADVEGLAPVVPAPPFGILQDLVRLGDLLEPGLGGGVVWIGVGVRLASDPPERLLDVIRCGIAAHAQELVVVSCHRRSLADAFAELAPDAFDCPNDPLVVHPHRTNDSHTSVSDLALIGRRHHRHIHLVPDG